jgi:predicted DNA-binding WGR domain protein
MKVSINCRMATAEVSKSARQMGEIFDGALSALAGAQPDFVNIGSLSVGLMISHPICGVRSRGRRSYSTKLGVYFVEAAIEYGRWSSGSWVERTDAFADATRNAVARIPGTRIAAAERALLEAIVEQARWRVRRSVPTEIEPVNSIFLIYNDASTGKPGVSFTPPPLRLGDKVRVVEVRPEDASSASREAAPAANEQSPPLAKLYQRIDGRLRYHEIWIRGRAVVEHCGTCGERGQVQEHVVADDSQASELFKKLSREARAKGFRPIPRSRHATLVVEYPMDGFDGTDDLQRRHEIEDFLDQQMGWLGLGHCDGGATGSGGMEIFCIVVDFGLAKTSISHELSRSLFGGFQRIYRMK